jgi:transcriptional regulator with XRE-family HTH domain
MAQLSTAQIERACYIRAVLGWHGVTQAGLAEIIGCTQQSASQKLTGKRRFTVDELTAIVDHYGLDAALVLRPSKVAELLGVRQSDRGLLPSTKYQVRRSEVVSQTLDLDQNLTAAA